MAFMARMFALHAFELFAIRCSLFAFVLFVSFVVGVFRGSPSWLILTVKMR